MPQLKERFYNVFAPPARPKNKKELERRKTLRDRKELLLTVRVFMLMRAWLLAAYSSSSRNSSNNSLPFTANSD